MSRCTEQEQKGSFQVLTALIALLLILVLLPSTTALEESRQITLLAVSEQNGEFSGSTAKLTIEAIKGKGRIFLDTQPLAKIDTQISTRLAKEITCNRLNEPCTNQDFIYTIHSDAPIIGGPSAGAAIAVVTSAVLLDVPVRDDVAITGTINTGGLVGAVGGIVQKIDAAAQKNMTTVLIPHGTRFSQETFSSYLEVLDENNNSDFDNSYDAVIYGAEKGVQVIEVQTLDEALYHATGYQTKNNEDAFTLPTFYQETMQLVAQQMCERAHNAKSIAEDSQDEQTESSTRYKGLVNQTNELLARSEIAKEQQNYYSAASYCFGAGIRAKERIYFSFNTKQVQEKIEEINETIQQLQEKEPATITDLQTAMLVDERVFEATNLLEQANFEIRLATNTSVNETLKQIFIRNAISSAAFAEERINSAISWSQFFDKSEQSAKISTKDQSIACQQKIDEAEQRRQYIGFYVPEYSTTRSEDLNQAYDKQDELEFALCIFYASKAKADYDAISSAVSALSEDKQQEALDIRQKLARETIAAQKDIPIIAYSFIEYSESLQADNDTYSALLYAQYALETADLSPYFPLQTKENRFDRFSKLSLTDEMVFGFALGMLLTVLIFRLERTVIFHTRKKHAKRLMKDYHKSKKKKS